MVLNLVLTEHWFDEYFEGRKSTEYRAMSDHWMRLIWERRDKITHVRFQRAFKKNPPKMTYEVREIDIGKCPYEGWDDNYFRIHLGRLVSFTQYLTISEKAIDALGKITNHVLKLEER